MSKTRKTKTEEQPIADICLYGNHHIGAGYLTRTAGGENFGDGQPRYTWGFTEAIFRACDELRKAGHDRGIVRIFAPDGQSMATTDVSRPAYFGDLVWTPAVVMTIDAEQLQAAAEKPDRCPICEQPNRITTDFGRTCGAAKCCEALRLVFCVE